MWSVGFIGCRWRSRELLADEKKTGQFPAASDDVFVRGDNALIWT